MKLPLHSTRLRRAAKNLFGWRSLRPNQLAAMRSVMKRRDTSWCCPPAPASRPSTRYRRACLFVEVAHCPTEDYRRRRLVALLRDDKRPGIIYVPTRRAAEELAEKLTRAGFESKFYHGGMPAGARHELHEAFLDDQVPIMVATSAFGMGIDKPNIAWVAHMALPDSPDSYLQEIGRAGRNGEESRVLLLWKAEDIGLQRFFSGGAPDETELRDLAALVREGPTTKTALKEKSRLGPRKLGQLLALLEHVGAVAPHGNHQLTAPRYAPTPADAAKAALTEAERQQAVTRSRTDMMRAFAETQGCRGRRCWPISVSR